MLTPLEILIIPPLCLSLGHLNMTEGICPSNKVFKKRIITLMEPIKYTCLKRRHPTETLDERLVRALFQTDKEFTIQHFAILSGPIKKLSCSPVYLFQL